jgi:hypothetical protein
LSHRGGAKECTVGFDDCPTNKVVDFEITQTPKSGIAFNYDEFSNGMKIIGFRRLMNRWKDGPNVIGSVHDYDRKASKPICDGGWNVMEYYDLNYIVNAFVRR